MQHALATPEERAARLDAEEQRMNRALAGSKQRAVAAAMPQGQPSASAPRGAPSCPAPSAAGPSAAPTQPQATQPRGEIVAERNLRVADSQEAQLQREQDRLGKVLSRKSGKFNFAAEAVSPLSGNAEGQRHVPDQQQATEEAERRAAEHRHQEEQKRREAQLRDAEERQRKAQQAERQRRDAEQTRLTEQRTRDEEERRKKEAVAAPATPPQPTTKPATFQDEATSVKVRYDMSEREKKALEERAVADADQQRRRGEDERRRQREVEEAARKQRAENDELAGARADEDERRAASAVKTISCQMTPEVRAALDSLVRDNQRCVAHVLKCNAKSGGLEAAGSLEPLTAQLLPRLADDIPEGAPRLVIMRYNISIDSKQIRSLLVLLYYNPSTANMMQKKMYQSTKDQLLSAYGSFKGCDITSLDDLSEAKLKKYLLGKW